MKTESATIFFAAWLPFAAFSQGRVTFDNIFTGTVAGTTPVTISTLPGTFNPNDGPPGAYLGADYTASLYYLPGTVTNQLEFDSRNSIWAADASFAGTTGTGPGHGYAGDGSGFFDGGTVQLFGVGLELTFQVRAFYNGNGLFTTYEQAQAAGHNVGRSNLVPLFLTLPPGPAGNLDGLLSFTVGIPEPSTFVLAALGGAALLLFRRRK